MKNEEQKKKVKKECMQRIQIHIMHDKSISDMRNKHYKNSLSYYPGKTFILSQ